MEIDIRTLHTITAQELIQRHRKNDENAKGKATKPSHCMK